MHVKRMSAVLVGLLTAGALSVALAPGAAAECYNPGSPSSVLHDNHDAAGPAADVVHTGEQELCRRGL
ncbi:hypothetical protein [Amycolatopsis palatopharyngis]|uniref:hypothetical protein n=1 Tax=Amycolatopsis palatopharyngis TaxID=187982 RepID=UPI000E2332D4|nr:hypothetical protein [Amycolatopsis palatopharyngis]